VLHGLGEVKIVRQWLVFVVDHGKRWFLSLSFLHCGYKKLIRVEVGSKEMPKIMSELGDRPSIDLTRVV
jgi:hypothetical protein